MRKKPILIILIYHIYFFLFIKVNGVLIFCIFYAIANHKCLIWLIVFLKNTWLNRSKAFKKDYQLGADLIVYVNLLWFHEFHQIRIQKKSTYLQPVSAIGIGTEEILDFFIVDFQVGSFSAKCCAIIRALLHFGKHGLAYSWN